MPMDGKEDEQMEHATTNFCYSLLEDAFDLRAVSPWDPALRLMLQADSR